MEESLISKKELLELTGISYGQLYRWKRKNLIPESWFIRKSTFTGQETFFPRREVLSRVERIKNMKDDLSLDDLADMLSPYPSDLRLKASQVLTQNIVSENTLQLWLNLYPHITEMSFTDILAAYVGDMALKTGDVALTEATLIMRTVKEGMGQFAGRPCDLLFLRTTGVGSCLLAPTPTELFFESNTKVVMQLQLASCIEQIKMRLL